MAAGLSGSINITGSTTVQPLAEKLAEDFIAEPDVEIEIGPVEDPAWV